MFNMMPYNHNVACRTNRGYFEDFANDFFRPFAPIFNGEAMSARPMKVDVKDEGDHYLLEAEMPGVEKDNLKVEVKDGVMTISASYDQNEEKKEEKYIYRERRCGSMSRAFNLEGIREEGIEAQFKDGVLTLNLPKVEEVKPEAHTIEIR